MSTLKNSEGTLTPFGHRVWLDDERRPHNVHGPAVIYKSGAIGWYIHGKNCTFDDWLVSTNKSPKEVMFFKLKYG